MAIEFEAVGDGGDAITADGRASGIFGWTHPGADGPDPIVIVPVAGYRTTGKPAAFALTYGGQSMASTRMVWGNNVDERTALAGWLQFFYLLDPPAGEQDIDGSWMSPLGQIGQIQFAANSLSYSGVAEVGALQVVSGTDFTTALRQQITSAEGDMVVHGFLQEWYNAITDYSATERLRLDDEGLRPFDAVIGDTPGARAVSITGRRTLGADYCGVALPLIAARPNTITAAPAEVTVTGHAPDDGTDTIIVPPRAELTVTTHPARAITTTIIRPPAAELAVTLYEPWTGLPIFPEATVLTLQGLNFNLYNRMPQYFQGYFAEPPYEMFKVNYPASLHPQSIVKGVEALQRALHTYDPPFIVLAMSQGAQVASRWMNEHDDDPDAPDETELQFVLAGNPLSSRGGRAIGLKEVDGVIGVPTRTDTRWQIIDVARRYDGWPDWPQDLDNVIAVQNARTGCQSMHAGYPEVDLFDPSHTIWRNGNTIYVLTREDDLPFYRGEPQPESLVAATRAKIEAAYTNRPPNDPPVEEVLPANTFEKGLIAKMLATP